MAWRRPVLVALFCSLSGWSNALAGAPDPENARAFAVREPIQVVQGAPIQRLMLPAQILLGSRRADLGDVRIFDGAGQAVPMARSDLLDGPGAKERLALKAYPIVGAPGTLNLTGMSLKIDDEQRARVVALDGRIDDTHPTTKVLGALFDVRAIDFPAVKLDLDVDVPRGQPVTFTLEQSRDLQAWSPLSSKVIFRPSEPGQALTTEVIDLPSANLKGSYLRLSWSSQTRLIAPVVVRGATLLTQGPSDKPPRLKVTVTGATLVNPRLITLSLPFATRIAAMAVDPVADGVVIPVRVYGRNDADQPWTEMGAGTALRIAAGATPRLGLPIDLRGGGFRLIKIEADQRSSGFATAPAINLYLDAVQVDFVTSGKPPFQVVTGLGSAPDAYLPLGDILTSPTPATEADLPLAKSPVAINEIASLPPRSDDGLGGRNLALWVILLAGVAGLSVMVWVLLRSKPDQTSP